MDDLKLILLNRFGKVKGTGNVINLENIITNIYKVAGSVWATVNGKNIQVEAKIWIIVADDQVFKEERVESIVKIVNDSFNRDVFVEVVD